MIEVINNLNRKLIYELNWNARQSHSTLAKKLRTSKQVIAYRIKKLEKQGILRSYHAVIDWRKLGYNSLRIYIKWENIGVKKEKEIYEFMRKDPLFMWIVKFEGEIDIGMYVWVKDVVEFSKKWFEFIAKYKKYLLRYEVYESIEMINYPLKFMKENYVADEIVIGRSEKADYDSTDYEILKALTENAQMQIINIAKRAKLSAPSTIQRIKALEKKKIIVGYYALVDVDKLGYEYYKTDFYVNDLSIVPEMEEFAKKHPKVTYRMKTIGGPDFEIEVVVKNAVEVKELINEIREKFGESIKFNRFHRFEYTVKQIYLPGEKVFS